MKLNKITPAFTGILTTFDVYEKDTYLKGHYMIAHKAGEFKPLQKIVAVGSSVRDFKVGDIVAINYDKFAVKKYDANSIQNDIDNNKTISFNLPIYDLADGEHLLIDQSCIVFKVDDYSEEDETTDMPEAMIKATDKKVVVMDKPSIITEY